MQIEMQVLQGFAAEFVTGRQATCRQAGGQVCRQAGRRVLGRLSVQMGVIVIIMIVNWFPPQER